MPIGEGSPNGVAVDPENRNILILGNQLKRVYRHNGTSWSETFISLPNSSDSFSSLAVDVYNPPIDIQTDLQGGTGQGTADLTITPGTPPPPPEPNLPQSHNIGAYNASREW